jgi:hypothetical protein
MPSLPPVWNRFLFPYYKQTKAALFSSTPMHPAVKGWPEKYAGSVEE